MSLKSRVKNQLRFIFIQGSQSHTLFFSRQFLSLLEVDEDVEVAHEFCQSQLDAGSGVFYGVVSVFALDCLVKDVLGKTLQAATVGGSVLVRIGDGSVQDLGVNQLQSSQIVFQPVPHYDGVFLDDFQNVLLNLVQAPGRAVYVVQVIDAGEASVEVYYVA